MNLSCTDFSFNKKSEVCCDLYYTGDVEVTDPSVMALHRHNSKSIGRQSHAIVDGRVMFNYIERSILHPQRLLLSSHI